MSLGSILGASFRVASDDADINQVHEDRKRQKPSNLHCEMIVDLVAMNSHLDPILKLNTHMKFHYTESSHAIPTAENMTNVACHAQPSASTDVHVFY